MPNSDDWTPEASRLQRLSQTVKVKTPYDLDGRLPSASPVPPQVIPTEVSEGLTLYIGPDDPGVGSYDLWFDTDEPVV